MAGNQEMQVEYNLFADIWKLFKHYYHTEDNKDFWNSLIDSAREIEKKYRCSLCNDLLIAVIMELENKHINEREELT
jgi:hypothetical protein